MQQFIAKKWIITFLLLFSFTIGLNTAFAETAQNEIFQMDIQVMPEYDTPDILLIYTVHFKNTSEQPYSGDFVWNVPKGSKNHIVVDKGTGDNHVQITVKPGDQNDQIVWKFAAPMQPGEVKPVQIEYYYNNLQGNPDKTFAYEFISEYPIAQLQMVILQPLKASNFKITPDFGQPQIAGDGFSIYEKEYSNLKKGDEIAIQASYTKADPNPSVAPPSQQQQAPGGQSTPDQRASSTTVLFFLVAFVAVLGLIIYKAMFSKKATSPNYDDEEFEDDEEIMSPKKKARPKKPIDPIQSEKKKLRAALLSGRISEETYHQLLAELNDEEDS